MLSLFMLGITPKILIHALVAHHTDTHLALDHDKADQFNKAGYHCTIDNLVVESPFLYHPVSIEWGIQKYLPEHQPAPLRTHLSSSHFIFRLRGPPAFILI
jgi:hypothetical protein